MEKKRIIAVASHTFNATEQNWSTTERGVYAIKWAIAKFDYFLRNHFFAIFTEHRSLTNLDQRVFNNARIRCRQEDNSCYKFILEFVKGNQMSGLTCSVEAADIRKLKHRMFLLRQAENSS